MNNTTKTRQFLISIVILLFICNTIIAETGKLSVTCAFMSQKPQLDGEIMNDNAWMNVPFTSGFIKYLSPLPADRQTYFKTGYTIDGIYFAVICDEPDITALCTNALDSGDVWNDDSVEFFIAPNGYDEYYHFVVNASGTRYNAMYTHRRKSKNKKLLNWKAVTSKGKGFWSVEVYFPFSILYTVPQANNNKWPFNIGRNAKPGIPEISSWSPAAYSFHNIESFGKLDFANEFTKDEQKKMKIQIKQIRLEARIDAARESWNTNINRWKASKDPFYASFLSAHSKIITEMESMMKGLNIDSSESILDAENKMHNLLIELRCYDSLQENNLRNALYGK